MWILRVGTGAIRGLQELDIRSLKCLRKTETGPALEGLDGAADQVSFLGREGVGVDVVVDGSRGPLVAGVIVQGDAGGAFGSEESHVGGICNDTLEHIQTWKLIAGPKTVVVWGDLKDPRRVKIYPRKTREGLTTSRRFLEAKTAFLAWSTASKYVSISSLLLPLTLPLPLVRERRSLTASLFFLAFSLGSLQLPSKDLQVS